MRAAGAPGTPRLKGIDFMGNSPEVAHRLIGATLLVGGIGGIIVETEAYDGEDPASHSFSGWCLNFVCREPGHGAGVLIRALEPTAGVSTMINRRRQQDPRMLCAGPGRLGQALAITRELNGKSIDAAPFSLTAVSTRARVVCGPRVGISKAVERPWRFGLAGSRYLSRPFR